MRLDPLVGWLILTILASPDEGVRRDEMMLFEMVLTGKR